MDAKPSMSSAMNLMEHPESSIDVPPLVDERVLSRFCRAVQSYADGVGLHDQAAEKLHGLRATLANLQRVASLCRLAIGGHPLSFARVIDGLHCIAVDFPSDPLEEGEDDEFEEDEPDDRVQLAAAIDLFAGASFVSKDKPNQRNRFVVGIVRAIEDAIAFPVTFAAEAATFLGEGKGDLSLTHALIIIATATQRLIESDQKCTPPAPAPIRSRLEGLGHELIIW